MFGARCNASTNFKTQLNHNAMNTPTPWKLIISETDKPAIVDSDGYSIARTTTNSVPENVANAELIVRAVNYHDRLVDCLLELSKRVERARKILQEHSKDSKGHWGILDTEQAQQLLTEIKESK